MLRKCTMRPIPPVPPFPNSFKQTSYRPIPYNRATLLYNLVVPEIPVRRPSQQIKTSAHHSTPTKGLLLTVVLRNLARDTQRKISDPHPTRRDTWLHNRSKEHKGTATRRNKEVTKPPINWTAIRTRSPSFSYFLAATEWKKPPPFLKMASRFEKRTLRKRFLKQPEVQSPFFCQSTTPNIGVSEHKVPRKRKDLN